MTGAHRRAARSRAGSGESGLTIIYSQLYVFLHPLEEAKREAGVPWRDAGRLQDAAPERTDLTFAARLLTSNGFCRKLTLSCNTPWSAMMSAV